MQIILFQLKIFTFQIFHHLLSEPPIGQWFEFSGLTRGSLKNPSLPEKIRVFQTNSASRVQSIPLETVGVEVIETKILFLLNTIRP
jgi:hypothetical protein